MPFINLDNDSMLMILAEDLKESNTSKKFNGRGELTYHFFFDEFRNYSLCEKCYQEFINYAQESKKYKVCFISETEALIYYSCTNCLFVKIKITHDDEGGLMTRLYYIKNIPSHDKKFLTFTD